MQIVNKFVLILILLTLTACGGGSGSSNQNSESDASGDNSSGLTEWEQKHGIGPVKEPIELGDVEPELAQTGQKLFKSKCSSCHKLDKDYVGPAQRNVVDQRSPEYIMNMILNPDEMVKKHPEAKKMLAEYMTPMPQQNVDREQARAILEYFRQANKEGSSE